MPQIYNKYSFGSELGSSLGTGISQGLNYLAQNKLNEMTQNREINRYSNLLQQSGIDSRDADVLAYHAVNNPQTFHHILEQYTPRQAQQQQGMQEFQQQPMQQIGQQAPQQQAQPNAYRQPTPEQEMQLKRLFQTGGNPEQKPSGLGEGLDLLHRTAKEQLLKTAVGRPAAEQIEAQAPAAIQQAQQQIQQQAQRQLPNQPAPVQPSALGSAAQIAEDLHPLLARSKKEQQKMDFEERKLAQQERDAAFKATQELRDNILQEAKSAKDSRRDLNRMEELNNEGKLDTPGYTAFLERSGLDIPALLNPESQEFQKIAQNFLRDAKTYYGGRVSNYEVQQFLRTIPSLSQSPEGRKRVIASLKNMTNAKIAYADTMIDIINENKKVPPRDLNEQIYMRIDDKLDKLAERFKKDLEKSVPESQNGLVTAAQAIGGSILGAPGTILNSLGGFAKNAAPLAAALL
jgi:hypothetical protein